MNDASQAPKRQLIVIKVGSALLVDSGDGLLRREWLQRLCGDIAALRREGHSVIVVSSGAIALGRRTLGLKAGALKLEESQAAAAVGQVRLAEAYVESFAADNIVAAQIAYAVACRVSSCRIFVAIPQRVGYSVTLVQSQ